MKSPSSCMFMPKDQYEKLSKQESALWQAKYDLSVEGIEKSYVKDLYWTTTWTPTSPAPGTDVSKLLATAECVVFRDPADESVRFPELSELLERTLHAPLSRIRFYSGTNPLALEGRTSLLEKLPARETTPQIACYRLPELLPIQVDYVDKLFAHLWQSVYDEQETQLQAISHLESSGAAEKQHFMPVNSLINRFVTEMSLEVHDERHYIIFTYEENTPQGSPSQTAAETQSPLPQKLDVEAVIPLEEDDEADSEDLEYLAMDESGIEGVLYDIYLELQNFSTSPETPEP